MVDHDLTNDFNYDSKQNRSQNYLFLGKIVNINSVQRLREMGKIFVVSMHICWYIGIKILHSGSSYPTANKDICYDHDDTNLNKSKISHFGVKYSGNEWPCTSTEPVWKLRRDQVIDMHGDFLSGVYCASEIEG